MSGTADSAPKRTQTVAARTDHDGGKWNARASVRQVRGLTALRAVRDLRARVLRVICDSPAKLGVSHHKPIKAACHLAPTLS